MAIVFRVAGIEENNLLGHYLAVQVMLTCVAGLFELAVAAGSNSSAAVSQGFEDAHVAVAVIKLFSL